MKHGLSDHVIERMESVFALHTEIKKVILYGSRAKGNYEKGSDIDLTVLGSNMNLALLMRIESELDDLMLPYTIDLSIFSHIKNHALMEHIQRVGVDFYSRQEERIK